MTRRRVSPDKIAAALGTPPGGWYEGIPVPTERGFHCCGRCHVGSATVPRPGETCLVCKLKERSEPAQPDNQKTRHAGA